MFLGVRKMIMCVWGAHNQLLNVWCELNDYVSGHTLNDYVCVEGANTHICNVFAYKLIMFWGAR